ncbi:hypothetical protein DZA58_08320 [Salmonella enterica subsp. enterica serovar Fresno]|nr:hypothetical protein DZA58_08320 [Salmonella enterica subsp. enterica serovar Fresno]EAA7371564.1 hypothetical protein [Salmonella enterica subsp. enterica]EAM3239611.1 hypothetical protein [Salmonella enterica]EBR8742388.1 hypothetical protein [Salmonella enterica subsp. enterica serovar Godesberg]EBV7306150.1 hypothetical protein [Salmonella enterica subsp. enterica serovar Lexington]PVN05923.1 hypothetical protein C4769_19455 [Salmonella enterica subsp. enterica serovar Elomrane]
MAFHCFAPELHRIYTSSFELPLSLAALENPSHIVIYAPGDFLAYRRDASRMMLCIVIVKTSSEQTSTQRPQVMQSR